MRAKEALLCFCILATLMLSHCNLQEGKEEIVTAVEDKLEKVQKTAKGLEEKVSKLHKGSKPKKGHEDTLSSASVKYVSDMVASVMSLRADLEQSGMAEGLLKSRLETLMTQSRLEKEEAAGNASATCPPPGFNALLPFDIVSFIKGKAPAAIRSFVV